MIGCFGRFSRRGFAWALALGAWISVGMLEGPCARGDGPGGGQVRAETPIGDDEPALRLAPNVDRSEADVDRVHAASLFSAARMAERREDLPTALRLYQRAFRADPEAIAALKEIVAIAFSLDRPEEAVRYAVKLAMLDAGDPVLLRRLGVVLTEEGSIAEALALYEKAAGLEKDKSEPLARIMLRLEMGRLYFLTNRTDRAAEAFGEVLAELEKSGEKGFTPAALKTLAGERGVTYELMGSAFLAAGRLDEAEKAFARLSRHAPNPAVTAFNQARVLAKRGESAGALENLQKYFDSRETVRGVAPYELLAELLAAQQPPGDLISKLQSLHTAQAGNIPLTFALAEEYRRAKRFADAVPLYEAVAAKQASPQAYRRLIECQRGLGEGAALIKTLGGLAEKSALMELLSKELKSIAAEDPKLTDQLIGLAAEAAKKGSAEDYGTLRAGAMLAAEAKRFEGVAQLTDAAIAAKPADKAELLLMHGMQLFFAEKYAQAADVFQRGVAEKVLPESNPAFYFYLAGALALDGKFEPALAAARAGAEKKPSDARIAARVGWIYYHAKKWDEAAKHYEELLERFDSDHESSENREVMHDTRLALSNIEVMRNRLGEAEEWVEQVLDEFPDDVGAHNDLGYLWADQGKRLARAERMIRKAVAAEPENAAYRDSLGWVLYRLGRYDEAVVEQEKAIAAKGDKEPDGVALDHLGDIYFKLERVEQAQATWRRAVESLEKAGEQEKIPAIREKINGKNS